LKNNNYSSNVYPSTYLLNNNKHFSRFLALYKGLAPKVLRLGPGGAIMLIVYENVYEYLQKRYPD
jgi:hypothetical protein